MASLQPASHIKSTHAQQIIACITANTLCAHALDGSVCYMWKMWKNPCNGNRIPICWFLLEPSNYDCILRVLEGVKSDALTTNFDKIHKKKLRDSDNSDLTGLET